MNEKKPHCPICGQKYYEKEHYEMIPSEIETFVETSPRGECVRITRVADASKTWKADTFLHSNGQI